MYSKVYKDRRNHATYIRWFTWFKALISLYYLTLLTIQVLLSDDPDDAMSIILILQTKTYTNLEYMLYV